jgi:hypothetical protein
MANAPLINATVNVTARDINGNNKPKQFNNVGSISFDYNKGMCNIVDLVLGSYYFPISPLSSLTYTIVSGVNGATTIVMF